MLFRYESRDRCSVSVAPVKYDDHGSSFAHHPADDIEHHLIDTGCRKVSDRDFPQGEASVCPFEAVA